MICTALVGEIIKIPFWKREKYWKRKYESRVLEEIINPINNKMIEMKNMEQTGR